MPLDVASMRQVYFRSEQRRGGLTLIRPDYLEIFVIDDGLEVAQSCAVVELVEHDDLSGSARCIMTQVKINRIRNGPKV